MINAETGVISVAEDAKLDIDQNGELYQIEIQATDQGEPHKQTGNTMIALTIQVPLL